MNDVCSLCNRDRLGPLDAYFCHLYDIYFKEVRDFGTSLNFSYEYERLTRVLLKIAYNSARSAGSPLEPFESVKRYIIGLDQRPGQVAVFVEVVSPSVVENKETGATEKVLPDILYRSGVTKLLSPAGGRVHTRIVAVNSFYFHLVLTLGDTHAQDFDEAVGDLGRLIKGVVLLTPETQEVTLQTSPQHALSSLRPHVEAYAEQYRAFFDRRNQSD